jgi:hypothetical protein
MIAIMPVQWVFVANLSPEGFFRTPEQFAPSHLFRLPPQRLNNGFT